MTAAVMAAGLLLAVPSASAATAPVDARAALLARATALVSVDAADLGFRVRTAPPRPGLRALTDTSRRLITLFLRPRDLPHVVAHDLAHEIGHAVDHVRMTPAGRRAYLARRGAPGAAWWPDSADDYATGAGDFAEVFALCTAASPGFRSRLAPRPADPCALIPPYALARRGGDS